MARVKITRHPQLDDLCYSRPAKRRKPQQLSSASHKQMRQAVQSDDDYLEPEAPSTDALLPQLSVSPVSVRPALSKQEAQPFEAWTHKSFTIAICACARNHAPFYHQLPVSLVSTYDDLDRVIGRLTNGQRTKSGVLTDLQGNDPFGIENWYEDYLACHLPGIIWHSDFYHGVDLGDRLAAQMRIRQSLSAPSPSTLSDSQRNPEACVDVGDDHSRISSVTPPPVVEAASLTASSKWTPWTATTNSSGRVTQLDSCNQTHEAHEVERLSIYNQGTTNVFDVESGDEGSVYIGGKKLRESRKGHTLRP